MLTYWTHRYVLVLLCSLLILAVISGLWLKANAYEHNFNLIELRADQLAELYWQSEDEPDFINKLQIGEKKIQVLENERHRIGEKEKARYAIRLLDVVQVIQIADAYGNLQTIKKDRVPENTASALLGLSPLNEEVLAGKKVREEIEVDSQTWLRVGVPIKQEGKAGKALYISMPASNVLLEIRRLYAALALLTGIITLTGWLGLYYVSRRLTRPLREVAAAAQLIKEGKYDPILPDQVKEQELQQLIMSFGNMAAELKQLEKLRTDLLAGVSHELRTPITSIRGMIQAVRDKVVTGREADEFLAISLNESKRLQQMVEELLDFSSFEAGAVPIEKKEVDLNDLIEEVICQIKNSPDFLQVRFDFERSVRPALVKGDQGRLRQILINLFKNSQKALASSIKTKAYIQDDLVIIDVFDNGGGISPKDRTFVFERFYRGIAGKSGKHGLGLGLTISRLLARAQGGDLILLSTGEGGTTFRLYLPQS